MAAPLSGLSSLREIERELGRLRAEAGEQADAPVLRTSAMTHVAWVPERWAEAATETLAGLAERHPSRTILLFPQPDAGEDGLDATADLRCFVRGSERRAVCSEVIEIRLLGDRTQVPASIVEPLVLPDIPVFLRWRGPLPFDAPELELLQVADRLVLDSAEWGDPRPGLARLPELFERATVSDIAWSRTQPWREAAARLWPDVAEVERVRVAGPEADALLLAHWLGARLDREVELEHEAAGEIELVEVDGRPVEPTATAPRSPSDLLSEQLDLFTRDRVYEEAVRSFSRVAT